MKRYLTIGPEIMTRRGNEMHAAEIKSAIDWVEDPTKATADYEPAVKATQGRLTALGVKTELVKLSDSKWVICKEDSFLDDAERRDVKLKAAGPLE